MVTPYSTSTEHRGLRLIATGGEEASPRMKTIHLVAQGLTVRILRSGWDADRIRISLIQFRCYLEFSVSISLWASLSEIGKPGNDKIIRGDCISQHNVFSLADVNAEHSEWMMCPSPAMHLSSSHCSGRGKRNEQGRFLP